MNEGLHNLSYGWKLRFIFAPELFRQVGDKWHLNISLCIFAPPAAETVAPWCVLIS